MPGSHIDDKIDPTAWAEGEMRTGDGFGIHFFRTGRGFVGRIGSAPIVPTTFVFGSGTAMRTRRV
ncbi:MAG: hypothetical protein JWR03_2886 [Cohnella sp.]|nr:hypothetical protein [Cohnella sp.]